MGNLLAILAFVAMLAAPARAEPLCIPGVYGDQFPGSKIAPLVRGNYGWHAYAYCKGPDGAPVPVFGTCAHGECQSSVAAWAGAQLQGIGEQLLSKPSEQVYRAWLAAHPQDFSCEKATGEQVVNPNTPRGRACAELWSLVNRDMPAWTAPPPPPTFSYFVDAATSADGTRPAYPFDGSTRGAMSAGRATARQPCAQMLPSGVVGKVWGTFGPEFRPDRVALCVKQ